MSIYTPKGPLLLLVWLDSYSSRSSWRHPDSFDGEQMKVTSIGWLMFEDKNQITIASCAADDGHQVSSDTTIPKVTIKERWEINL